MNAAVYSRLYLLIKPLKVRKIIVIVLLDRGIDIEDNINQYALDDERDSEDEDGNTIEFTDCRPLIFAEVEHRRKRALFDSLINHHIEYQPYINSIYTLCYPTGNRQLAKHLVGWIRAEAIRDKYYFDEILFYVHMHIANIVMRSVKKCNDTDTDTDTDTAINISVCNDHFASSSNKTFTLMKVLADRLTEYLKPKKIELCYNLKCSKEGTKKCSRCHTVYYCSLECQKSHWKHHKLVCKSSSS